MARQNETQNRTEHIRGQLVLTNNRRIVFVEQCLVPNVSTVGVPDVLVQKTVCAFSCCFGPSPSAVAIHASVREGPHTVDTRTGISTKPLQMIKGLVDV
jgi:hypothetical protein